MLNIQLIRENPDHIDEMLARRGHGSVSADLLLLDNARKAAIARAQDLQAERNAASKKIGQAKAQGNEELAAELMSQVTALKDSLQQAEEEERQADAALQSALSSIPNMPLDGVPTGSDESSNVEIRQWDGKSQKSESPQHFEIGEQLGLMDFEAASRMSGARFVVLKGALARLERALGNFMIDLHTSTFGYTEIAPPFLVRDSALFGTGQLPKFSEDLFKTDGDHWLIPTAEVPLTNLVREQILSAEVLPLRYTAFYTILSLRSWLSRAGHARYDPPTPIF